MLILIRHRKLYRLRHTYDTRDILRTGTTLSLLRSAVDKGTDLYTLADIEETDALRAVELVAAGAEHIDIHFIHIDLQMSKCLNRVRMEQDPVFFRDRADLCG